MSLWRRLIGKDGRDDWRPLYAAIVAEARRPEWYKGAAVPDTVEGRFDMVALVMSLVMIRLEREAAWGREASARLTEVFVEDMDGTMRQWGVGDVVVGKRVGGMMGALGGRLGAYRSTDRRGALIRNLYRGEAPAPAALAVAEAMVGALEGGLAIVPRDALQAGRLG
ncbi:Ubiquinol-cytochrome c chaperone domain-containing protein [Sphingomonas antarctica]|uniref:ubiquinol-cytochrome C chaperone family protein n=1 Tax=Sphingomonas antarctica TaxID=2040274 RepID=UPI0039E865B3